MNLVGWTHVKCTTLCVTWLFLLLRMRSLALQMIEVKLYLWTRMSVVCHHVDGKTVMHPN
uniref:Uncharacterized protein n=1 Tax=Arundo donax TaxID=35708 RepID=A0A0A8YSG7_ARUDO